MGLSGVWFVPIFASDPEKNSYFLDRELFRYLPEMLLELKAFKISSISAVTKGGGYPSISVHGLFPPVGRSVLSRFQLSHALGHTFPICSWSSLPLRQPKIFACCSSRSSSCGAAAMDPTGTTKGLLPPDPCAPGFAKTPWGTGREPKQFRVAVKVKYCIYIEQHTL